MKSNKNKPSCDDATLINSSTPSNSSHEDTYFFTATPALISGAMQAIFFNPIDRALYVRVRYRRQKLLVWRNFDRPFQGFMNAAVYRTLVGASYLFWQDRFGMFIERTLPRYFHADQSPHLSSFLNGLMAGAVNGFTLNTLQVIKFRMWSIHSHNTTFIRTARHMFKADGLSIFFRGCMTTTIRDSVFGIVYETARNAKAVGGFLGRFIHRRPLESVTSEPTLGTKMKIKEGVSASASPSFSFGEFSSRCGRDISRPPSLYKEQHNNSKYSLRSFVSNLMAAVFASIITSPINYVRSVIYSTPCRSIPLGYAALYRSFFSQIYYTYRKGDSYVDSRSMPELWEAEHLHPKASPSTSLLRPVPTPTTTTPTLQGDKRKHVAMQRWLKKKLHCHHPVAAWRWANSRLNIGWGSLRVGLGMAISQCTFYFIQENMRNGKQNHSR